MMRRTTLRGHQALVKGPQIPGPTLHGWGRTVQKRRLEYESYDNAAGGPKPYYKGQYDAAGIVHRSTNYMECRTYFNIHQRWGTWFLTFGGICAMVWASATTWHLAMFEGTFWWQEHVYKRKAWW